MNNRVLCLLALAVLTTQVFAVEEDLGAIKVTEVRGNKDEKSFLQSNESISVLKQKNLNRGDVQNSLQMLNGFANVQTQSDRAGETFSIRGISDMGVTGFQKDNLASILVDDLFQTTLSVRAGSFENWDLESVEIHRGAQSTTQGVNSLAGNILLYHARPAFETEGAAKLTLGNYGRREAAVVTNHALNDKLAVRLSYNKETTDGFIKNIATRNDKWGARNKDHFVTDLLYKLSSSQDLRFNIKLLRMHRGGSYVQSFDDYEVNENHDYNEITNNQQSSLIHNLRLSETLTNKIIIGATRADSHTESDEDGTAGPVDAGTRQGNDKDYFMSFENQLKYKSDRFRNVLGLHLHRYYLNNHFHMERFMTGLPGPFAQIPVTQENSKTRQTYALFDSVTYDLTANHALTAGARFEVVKNKFGAEIQAPIPGRSGLFEDTSTNTILLPKLGYNYHSGNYHLGASYNQGYRIGGVSVNRQQSKTVEYDPEKTHNYELSYKFMVPKVLLALNTFYTKWNDQQVEVNLGSTFDTQVENAATSELYGAEAEASYLFDNADSARLNVGYVHTQFQSFTNRDTNGRTVIYTGNDFPDAAPVTGQFSYWKVINDNWKIIYVSRYVAEAWTDPENTRRSDEQFYSDVNGQFNFDQYLLELYVRNIFNQHYRLLNGAPRTTTSPYQANYHRVSAPREFGLRLNYFW